MSKKLWFFRLCVGAMLSWTAVSTACADGPATLHIGRGAETACAMGCDLDLNSISGGALDIFQSSGGAPNLAQPVLLIIGIPNDAINLFALNPIGSLAFPSMGEPRRLTEAGLVVSEPGTMALFGTGLLGLAWLVRRRLAR